MHGHLELPPPDTIVGLNFKLSYNLCAKFTSILYEDSIFGIIFDGLETLTVAERFLENLISF